MVFLVTKTGTRRPVSLVNKTGTQRPVSLVTKTGTQRPVSLVTKTGTQRPVSDFLGDSSFFSHVGTDVDKRYRVSYMFEKL